MDMQKMWNAYAQECRVLRERIAALRQALEDEKLMPMERHELDRRKRLLSEEARDLEWSMRSIAVYAAQEGRGCRMRMTARTAWEEMLFPEDLRVERWEKQRVACLIAKNIMENEISARQKQILVLYYKEKKTMPEIARQLGVCISTVSRTHRRACETVRSRLRSYGLLG